MIGRLKKKGLRNWHNQKKGGLRCTPNSKKGGLRCGSGEKGGLPPQIPVLDIYASPPHNVGSGTTEMFGTWT